MTVLEIKLIPDPVLRKKAEPVKVVTNDIISINKNFSANKSLFYKDLEGKNRVIKIY